ncbi:MAG: MATE family efflux transporter [Oscillospiraceae bacterium]|jgi:putative MATE family efflux protein|nr:MATE family efflux transporter [Oscillospiraceae bacterium]
MASILKSYFSPTALVPEDRRHGELPKAKAALKDVAKVAAPAVAEMILVSIISSVDSMMVSTLGPEAIAAVGITDQPRMITLAAINSLNAAVTTIVARRKGQNDRDGANRCLTQALMVSLMLVLTLASLCFTFARPILLFAGAQPDVIDMGVTYMRIILFGVVFTALSLTMTASQRGVGNTRISMVTNMTANIVNVIFNYLLIGGNLGFPRLGIAGAALATSIGNFTAFVMALVSVTRPGGFLQLRLRQKWAFDKETMKNIANIGSGTLVDQACARVGFFINSKLIASLGTIPYATHLICMHVVNLSFSCGDGLSVAATSLVGQNLGKERPDLSLLYGKLCQRVAFCFSLVLMTLFLVARRPIIGLFSQEAEILELGSQVMFFAVVICLVQISQVVFTGCLRGAGDVKYVAMVTFISITILRPSLTGSMAYLLGWGLLGAWAAFLLDQCVRFVFVYRRFSSGKWAEIRF